MNALSPSSVCSFATAGISGTGTFSAGPSSEAGLYDGVGVGVAVGVGETDSLLEPDAELLGSADGLPAHPAMRSSADKAKALVRSRREFFKERRDIGHPE
ncbi:hypothetical protein GCM10009611_04310 [Arthrobacter roseus]